jgi:hypothetical protein
MKRVLLYFSFFIFHFSIAQSWKPVGIGIEDTGVLGNAIGALAVYNGELYAGGQYFGHCPKNNIARWNGIKWDSVSSGTKDTCVCSMASYDSMLYAGGQFYEAGGVGAKAIAQWDGTKWDSVGCGISVQSGIEVEMLALYKGEMYAGGNFSTIGNGSKIGKIARWNGIKWDSVGKGLYGSAAQCAAVYNRKLYVGGSFDSAGGVTSNNIACWDGTKWDSVGTGIKGILGPVYSLAVYNGKLYAGGSFNNVGSLTANNIASWDGTKWDSVGAGITGNVGLNNIYVFSLVAYNGNLYAGGIFDSAGGKPASEIAKWDGTKWSNVGAGFNGKYLGVYTLAVYDSSLYAGGDFTKSGATTVMGIASWRDSVLLGENELTSIKQEVKLYPNPNSGAFTISMNGANEKAEISIYNMLGEQVYQTVLNTGNTQIDLSKEAKGIYLYRVVSESGEPISQDKFIIQ